MVATLPVILLLLMPRGSLAWTISLVRSKTAAEHIVSRSSPRMRTTTFLAASKIDAEPNDNGLRDAAAATATVLDQVTTRLNNTTTDTNNTIMSLPWNVSVAVQNKSELQQATNEAAKTMFPALRLWNELRHISLLLWRRHSDARRARRRRHRRRPIQWWTDHPAFQSLAERAFRVCAECTGDECTGNTTTNASDAAKESSSSSRNMPDRIDRMQVYAGILLAHLHLAQYFGLAACHPPSRENVNELFVRADVDQSGTLTLDEFTAVLVLSLAHITSRLMVYWSLILLVVPLAAPHTTCWLDMCRDRLLGHPAAHHAWLGLIHGGYRVLTGLVERIVTLSLFVLVVPFVFNRVDQWAPNVLLKKPRRWKRKRWW